MFDSDSDRYFFTLAMSLPARAQEQYLEYAVKATYLYKFEPSCAGTDALALLESGEKIDVLFSDMQLPGGVNGLQIAKKAMELRPTIKVLLTSGYAEQEILASEDMARFPLLRKPYGPANLIVELKKMNVME